LAWLLIAKREPMMLLLKESQLDVGVDFVIFLHAKTPLSLKGAGKQTFLLHRFKSVT
jgi:hypothetical protein